MDKPKKRAIVNTMRKILDDEGFTQADLHDKVHNGSKKLTLATINKLCTGKNLNPSAATMTKIIQGLNALVGSTKYKKDDVFKVI